MTENTLRVLIIDDEPAIRKLLKIAMQMCIRDSMHSLRGGDVVGDHTVVFASDGERLELTHKEMCIRDSLNCKLSLFLRF